MAYYPVAHFLHSSFNGSQVGLLGTKADQLTDDIWEYIPSNGPFPSSTSIPEAILNNMRHDLEYFYPFDTHSYGKDLTPNHLIFRIYTQVAIFLEDKWPIRMRRNGHPMLNGQKMCE